MKVKYIFRQKLRGFITFRPALEEILKPEENDPRWKHGNTRRTEKQWGERVNMLVNVNKYLLYKKIKMFYRVSNIHRIKVHVKSSTKGRREINGIKVFKVHCIVW